MTYDFMRHFADSWGLLAMLVFFLGAVVWVFRPGSREHYDHAAKIPLENASED